MAGWLASWTRVIIKPTMAVPYGSLLLAKCGNNNNNPHGLTITKSTQLFMSITFIEKLGPGTKSKSKGEALGQSISLN